MNKAWFAKVFGLCAVFVSAQLLAEGFDEPENFEAAPLVINLDELQTVGDLLLFIEESSGGESPADIQVRVITKGGSRVDLVCKKLREAPRIYEDGVSAKEGEDIAYILKSLANHSLAKLKGEESSLKKAGDRIDHVHPLQFLLFAFSNEELKVCLRNLEGRSWVWKDFLKGVTESLAQEYGRDNLMPYLDDFSKKLKLDSRVLMPNIKNGRWEKFISLLISIIPRAEGSDRYNM